jgi:HEPN domain-containing protein
VTEKFETYVSLARDDLKAAKMLMRELPRHSAFNIEQAAEKLLKAVLTVEGKTFSVQHHQLGALAQLLPEGHEWRADLMAFDQFTSYATSLRYPTPGGNMPSPPEQQALQRGWEDVAALVDEIEQWCRERVDEKRQPSGGRR